MKKSILIIVVVLISCASSKKDFTKMGGLDEAIQNAILDFSKKSRLYKKNSVFTVWAQDTLYRMVLDKSNENKYKWVEGDLYEQTIAVSITASYNKILMTDSTKVGSIGKFPSRYIERDGKLFYWWDSDQPLKQETLDALGKYGLLQDDEGGWVKFPDMTINDAQKAAHYYFCRNNLKKYKRVTTNKGIGYYDAPKLDCN